jgi:hypothetical protein
MIRLRCVNPFRKFPGPLKYPGCNDKRRLINFQQLFFLGWLSHSAIFKENAFMISVFCFSCLNNFLFDYLVYTGRRPRPSRKRYRIIAYYSDPFRNKFCYIYLNIAKQVKDPIIAISNNPIIVSSGQLSLSQNEKLMFYLFSPAAEFRQKAKLLFRECCR